jgi:uncharacterized protein (TIGR03437 family)
MALDAVGNLYFSDAANHVVRRVDTAGIITTVAGNGPPGYSGDGGPATAAQLNTPMGVGFDSEGNLYISDSENNRVRKVSASGVITTYGGNGNVRYTGAGPAISTVIDRPWGLAVDSAGNVYVAETSSSRVQKIDTNGMATVLAGVVPERNGFSGDGGPATAAQLYGPIGLTVDAAGNVYIADNINNRVRRVSSAGIITTYAGTGGGTASTPLGDGGPATSAFIGVARAVTVDTAGNLYIAASAGGVVRIRKVAPGAGLSAAPTTLAFSYTIGGTAPAPQTVAVTSTGAASGFTASASTTSGGSWLSVSPTSGSTPGTVTVSVNPAGVPGGVYQGAVTLTPTTAGMTGQAFAVTLTVAGAGAPTFSATSVYNALGYQTKLAPGVVFVVFGTAMGPGSLAAGAGPNYPTELSGTSITLTPAAGGPAINARMVYTVAGQVAGLLPSSISPGTYAMRITYNGLTSPPQNVTVVARSLGIATVNSAGTGTAQATIGNVNGGISLTRFTSGSVAFGGNTWTLTPAHPGDTLVLWGTGGGADSANDTGGTSGDQTAAGNFRVLAGSRQITPLYAGASSGYPGLWQINFTLPADLPPGCFVPVQVSAAGGELSNAVTIPIAPSDATACTDPQLSREALGALDGGGSIVLGGFAIAKVSATQSFLATPGSPLQTITANQESLSGGFGSYSAAAYAALNSGIQIGACTITDRTATAGKNPGGPESFLDAGLRIGAAGPGLPAGAGLAIASTNPGPVYQLLLSNGAIPGGGRYTVTGSGGRGVGAFNAAVDFPASFTVTNWSSLTSIERARPLTINWTSSGADQIFISGNTLMLVGRDPSNANITRSVTFTCQVPSAPGTYTVPASVTSYLFPAALDAASAANGSATLAVQATNTATFTAPLVGGGQAAAAAFTSSLAYSKNLEVR